MRMKQLGSLEEAIRKKACINCKNFVINKDGNNVCKLFYNFNYVTGDKIFIDAEEARLRKDFCGITPRFFDQTETKKVEKIMGFRMAKIKHG